MSTVSYEAKGTRQRLPDGEPPPRKQPRASWQAGSYSVAARSAVEEAEPADAKRTGRRGLFALGADGTESAGQKLLAWKAAEVTAGDTAGAARP